MTPARSLLSGAPVSLAMRRLVAHLPAEASLAHAINHLIKFKHNALLVSDPGGDYVGVVSKSDMIAAYYAGLPVETMLSEIMSGPPETCTAEDPLEEVMEHMRAREVHRLYVAEPEGSEIIGVISLPDIVGIIYRACRPCPKSRSAKSQEAATVEEQLRVKDVMTPQVRTLDQGASLSQVMEELSTGHLTAMLLTDGDGQPAGVISTTGLILAYKHGVDPGTPVQEVMTKPVRSCNALHPLMEALHQMIFSDVHRLFVQNQAGEGISGVLSLSDVTRFRSGSCRACTAARLGAGLG